MKTNRALFVTLALTLVGGCIAAPSEDTATGSAAAMSSGGSQDPVATGACIGADQTPIPFWWDYSCDTDASEYWFHLGGQTVTDSNGNVWDAYASTHGDGHVFRTAWVPDVSWRYFNYVDSSCEVSLSKGGGTSPPASDPKGGSRVPPPGGGGGGGTCGSRLCSWTPGSAPPVCVNADLLRAAMLVDHAAACTPTPICGSAAAGSDPGTSGGSGSTTGGGGGGGGTTTGGSTGGKHVIHTIM